jgi:hypothetical protein
MNDSHAERRIALGAYVVGALHPAERADVEEHLARCAACREELGHLSPITATLGHLSEADALAAGGGPARPAPQAPHLLDRTLAELARRRRSARLRLQAAFAGGAVAVVALGAAVGLLVVTRPAPSAAAVLASARLSGSDASTGVTASADLYAEAWGTSIHLDISGVTPGESCELVAVSRDGSQQVAGTWTVGYTGGVDLDGATGISPSQLSSLEIVTTSGTELVALQG